MGRPKKPISEDGPAATFAAELRSMRLLAGRPTYREMSQVSGWSYTGLSEADGGDRLPTWECARAYLRGCHVGEDELGAWQNRWASAARAITMRAELASIPQQVATSGPTSRPTPLAGTGPLSIPALHAANTGEDLVLALKEIISSQGYTFAAVIDRVNDPALPLRVKVAKAEPEAVLKALASADHPPLEVVIRVVAACGGNRHDIGEWFRTWHRIKDAEQRARAQLQALRESSHAGETRSEDPSTYEQRALVQLASVKAAVQRELSQTAGSAENEPQACRQPLPALPPPGPTPPIPRQWRPGHGGRHREPASNDRASVNKQLSANQEGRPFSLPSRSEVELALASDGVPGLRLIAPPQSRPYQLDQWLAAQVTNAFDTDSRIEERPWQPRERTLTGPSEAAYRRQLETRRYSVPSPRAGTDHVGQHGGPT